MPAKLSTTIAKISSSIPNKTNCGLVLEYHHFLEKNGVSERHQNNALKAVLAYAMYLGRYTSFFDINKLEQIVAYLDKSVKPLEIDPEKKWITTWNDKSHRIKHFFRWLYNRYKGEKEEEEHHSSLVQSEWLTPEFAKIRTKKTKRLSPYSETEIWDRDEVMAIIKYEPYIRNKAALALFWDLDARNHEITLLKVEAIRLREKYGKVKLQMNQRLVADRTFLPALFYLRCIG